ncbi:hypothetical protein CYMTET_11515 [Cymbomonas tetramitiformis]|uniref:Uncharacterized protein n=1 Tax=Cymbomonas tetramitiformis TaxID=36881 RepID=A0AAE0GNI6_9CHLO|nr:hypothetical protein CYMTET_11515 [Cymbomonas tetramitiformis]
MACLLMERNRRQSLRLATGDRRDITGASTLRAEQSWHPGPSHPQVVVPYVDWVWVWEPPSPGGAPPSSDYDPDEEERPTLNEDHGSGRCGVDYVNAYYGMDVTSLWLQTGSDRIADVLTQPLPRHAFFYGIELPSEEDYRSVDEVD